MRKIIYITILAGIISCSKKNNEQANIPTQESQKKTIIDDFEYNQQHKTDTISKKNTENAIVDSNLIDLSNQEREIKIQLIGTWGGLINDLSDLNDVNKAFVYSFSEDGVLFVSKKKGDGNMYNYSICRDNCENNSRKTNSYFIKLIEANDCFSSEFLEFKNIKGKVYLILENQITYVPSRVFVKLSNNPDFLPNGFE